MNTDYSALSVAELRQIIKERGIKNTSALRKAQLAELLTQLDAGGHKQGGETAGRTQQDPAPASAPVHPVKEEADRPVRESGRDHRGRDVRETRNSSSRPSVRRQISSQPGAETGVGSKSASRQQTGQGQGRQGQMRGNTGRYSQTAGSAPGRQGSGPQHTPGGTHRQAVSQTPSSQEEREIPGFSQLDSGNLANGILEVLAEGYGFIRCENYLPGENDVYVSPAQIRRFRLKTGDIVSGNIRIKNEKEKYSALLYVRSVNGMAPEEAQRRPSFEDMTPVFPDKKINLETAGAPVSMRIMNLLSPIGRGQRGMIVAPPKTGKTTLLKQVARAIHTNYPDMNMIILLIDERPEEVTDIKEYIEGDNVEVIYSTFDERPEHHERVSEMVLERAKRLVEHKKDVVILLDSITRLARACNLTVQPSGRTLTGGLDPAALYMPKRFFGSARNMREGGSLTVLATALVETGSKMDDVVFEEFKGTGNMELVLDRRLSDKRIFPAINLPKSGTRRDDLLLTKEELDATYSIRHALGGVKSEEAFERILEMFKRTRTNQEFITALKRSRYAVQ